MTIGHSLQREEMDPRTPQSSLDLKPSSLMLQGVLFYISLHFISSFQPSNPLFLPNLKIQIEFTILNLIANHLCEENSSLCSTLEPLYYSSHATVVGGIRFINFVDSRPPSCIRIRGTNRYNRAYTCTNVPIGTTELILVQRYS